LSAIPLFTPEGGENYTPAIDRIATLPKSKRQAALLVWNAIVGLLPKDRRELHVTDHMLAQSSWLKGFSERFVQKGLHALSVPTDKNPDGLGLIDRDRRRGLRKITVVGRLTGKDRAAAKASAQGQAKRDDDGRDRTGGQIPNVGRVAPTTQAHVDLAAAIAKESACLPEPTPEQVLETRRLLDELKAEREQRQRREQGRRGKPPDKPPD
jgi:hypothetical protein